MSNTSIYVSYSWKPESKAVVDEIQAVLKAENIEIQRDVNVLTYKGKINEFMQLIGKGKIVILVIGKDYLESENCMYELMQIASHGDIYERIVPIYLPSADIHKVILRAKYITFWVDKNKEIEALDTRVLMNMPEDDLRLYRDISQKIPDLMQFLANINALSLEMHRENNWKDMINTIKSMLQRLGTVDGNSQNKTTQMTFEEFKKYLIDLIDTCKMDEFFQAISGCPYDYDKPMYNSLKGQFLAYPAFMNPCGVFSQQWKVFVGTLREKK